MRKLVIFCCTIVFFLNSCKVTKLEKSKIVYLFPPETEKTLFRFIEKIKEKPVIFYLERTSDDKAIKLHLEVFENMTALKRNFSNFTNTNRFVFVDNKYYPIMFDYDYDFYTLIKDGTLQVSLLDNETKNETDKDIPSLNFRLKNPHLIGYKKRIRLIDWSNYLLLDNKGNILENGLGNGDVD